MAFAGIWEVWRSREAEEKTPLITFSILTTDAVGPLQDIHHRMPLMIAKRDREKWLDPDLTEVKGTAVDGLLAPVALSIVDELELRPVSPLVNSVRNNNVDLLRRAEPMPVELDSVELDQGSLFDVS
jgi:putative SOS response-associated peptidase YedK